MTVTRQADNRDCNIIKHILTGFGLRTVLLIGKIIF